MPVKRDARYLNFGQKVKADANSELIHGWQGLMPERYPDVCLAIGKNGTAQRVSLFIAEDSGYLVRNTDHTLWLRRDRSHRGGTWSRRGMEGSMDYALPNRLDQRHFDELGKEVQIPLSKETRFFVNLIPVTRSEAPSKSRAFVFVFFDRHNRAKYVDRVEISVALYLGDAGIRIERAPTADTPGRLISAIGDKKEYVLAPTLKVYGRKPFRTGDKLYWGFANLVLDKEHGWVTHIFFTGEGPT